MWHESGDKNGYIFENSEWNRRRRHVDDGEVARMMAMNEQRELEKN